MAPSQASKDTLGNPKEGNPISRTEIPGTALGPMTTPSEEHSKTACSHSS